MKYTLVYDRLYLEIQNQDLPPKGYYFVCEGYDGETEVRFMYDEINSLEVARCYDKNFAKIIAEKLNAE